MVGVVILVISSVVLTPESEADKRSTDGANGAVTSSSVTDTDADT